MFLIFVRSGDFYLANTSGIFRAAGQYGRYWSSRTNIATTAYNLLFDTTVYPSRGPSAYYHAFPLRCLSTVLDM